MSIKNAVLASAVASLFVSGTAFAKDKTGKKAGSTVKCEGINGCKGQGVTETTSKDCTAKGGKVATAQK